MRRDFSLADMFMAAESCSSESKPGPGEFVLVTDSGFSELLVGAMDAIDGRGPKCDNK